MVDPMRTPVDHISRFSHWLRREIENGFAVGPDLHAYLNTTFGHTDLPRILATAESADIDSLMDLLFFPDEQMRLRFEAQWGALTFSRHDLEGILKALTDAPPQALVRTDINAIRIPLPPFAAETLLQRLNLLWQPARPLAPILQEVFPETRRVAVRMHLRCAALAWHQAQIDLLERFASKMPANAADYGEAMLSLLSILPEIAADQTAEEFLITRKRRYHQLWCKAEEFERRRRASNMEILMLQGERAVLGTPQHWRARMDQMDRLSLLLFNRIESIQPPLARHIDVTSGEARDMDLLLGLLG
jgi:hypothetical protein